MSSGMKERLCRSLEKVLHAETRELPAVAGGILLFFLLLEVGIGGVGFVFGLFRLCFLMGVGLA